ncbi:MAG TPA: S8 family serine peptidase [Pilimelia sp.]|nr:S8 family serine peptidase [Pilimelia sp.]
MRTRIWAGGAVLAGAVALAMLPFVATAGTAPGAAGTGAAGTGAAVAKPVATGTSVRTVTLITGDRVTVLTDRDRATSVARVAPGKGRTGITFITAQAAGRRLVIPSDVLSLLRAGRIDMRLFDVDKLLEFGYDDRRKDLPLIVTGDPAATRSRASGLRGASAIRAIPGGTALRAAKAEIGAVWQGLRGGLTAKGSRPPKLWLDGVRQRTLDASVPQIGAPTAWAAGYTGEGVKVAVVDTGVDATHPDLAGRVIAERDFVDDGHNRDLIGHGTHVAATIGSNGSRYRGVAPGAGLLSAKVCMEFGCPESAILAGMQWAAEQGAKVVNMSLGGPDTPEQDPLEAAVEDLTARHGILFVISAGNSGADESIGSPGSADSALTVGAVTKSDELAAFSSRGPRVGDAALKPDITAPGQDIVAARSKDTDRGQPGDTHLTLSGTSMAAPHVAGAAAILAQRHPDWTPAALKAALMGSAVPKPGLGAYAQAAGRVDVARALNQTVLAEPASVSFGRQLWPHSDDAPVTRTVTYRNLGTAAVTLELSMTGAPAGMFTLSAGSVTVPAGGTAGVTLTADTRVAGPDGYFGGHLVARAGDVSVSTPFAVDKEIEHHELTLRHRNRAGQPATDFYTMLFDPYAIRFFDVFADADSKLRLPKGKYVVLTDIVEADSSANTHLVAAELTVDRARTLTLDARSGRPISVTVPQPDAAPLAASVDATIEAPGDGGTALFTVSRDSFDGLYAGRAGGNGRNPLLTSLVSGLWAKGGVDPADSPYITMLTWREKGRAFAGLTKRVTMADLATVEAHHSAQGSTAGGVYLAANWADGAPVFLGHFAPARLPGQRLEYTNAHDGARWRRVLVEGDGTGPSGNVLDSPLARLKPGKRYVEKRNRAVYGPGFAPPVWPDLWLTRAGDTMTLVPPLLNDQLNWTGGSGFDEYRITLDLDGQRVLDEPLAGLRVVVPPGAAAYRVGAEVTRAAPNVLSTKVSCVWTFRSGTVAGDKPVPLPVSAVRFRPALDAQNTAPAGAAFEVPFEVQRHPGSAAGTVRTLTVEVSYDDGATWQDVRVTRYGQRGTAFLEHPAGAGFVSLRANATDTAGNTVSQTVIRAYRIG